MKIAVGSDERNATTDAVVEHLRRRGVDVELHGPLADVSSEGVKQWAEVSADVARTVASGQADRGVLFCWTGTGCSIAANKVDGIRAAQCPDAETASGARRWNDANVLALSLRATSEAVLSEILDAWFEGMPSREHDDVANIRHVDEIV